MQLPSTTVGRLVLRQHKPLFSTLSTKRTQSFVTTRQGPFLPSLRTMEPKPSTSRIFQAIRHSQQQQQRFNSASSSSGRPTPRETFADPNRPGLYYHLTQPPTPVSKTLPAFSVSFLPERPPTPSSKTVIGWLIAQGREEEEGKMEQNPNNSAGEGGAATLEDFLANPEFLKVLHSVIKEGLKEGVDEIQKAGAMQTMQGWMHIHDERNIPPVNRIGDPDDIIGTVLVENSEILADTYQPMPAYRLVTSDGPMQLTPGLAQKLHDTLSAIADAERSSAP